MITRTPIRIPVFNMITREAWHSAWSKDIKNRVPSYVCHIDGLQSFESTIEQTTETVPPSLNSRCNDKTKAVNDSYYTTGVTSYVEFVPNPKNSLSVCSNFNYSGALGIVYFLFTVWYHQTMWSSRACFSAVLKEERKVLIFLRLCLAVLTSACSSSFMLMLASLVRTELKKAIVI